MRWARIRPGSTGDPADYMVEICEDEDPPAEQTVKVTVNITINVELLIQ